jgi:hypothetical protein
MAADVDVSALLGAVVAALPKEMTIDQLAVTVSAASSRGDLASKGKSSGVGGLDLSDAVHIGTVTVSGTGSTLTDLAGYVDALRATKGIFEPYPLSNQTTEVGTSYSLQLTLTDALLTHRYELPEGGK